MSGLRRYQNGIVFGTTSIPRSVEQQCCVVMSASCRSSFGGGCFHHLCEDGESFFAQMAKTSNLVHHSTSADIWHFAKHSIVNEKEHMIKGAISSCIVQIVEIFLPIRNSFVRSVAHLCLSLKGIRGTRSMRLVKGIPEILQVSSIRQIRHIPEIQGARRIREAKFTTSTKPITLIMLPQSCR